MSKLRYGLPSNETKNAVAAQSGGIVPPDMCIATAERFLKKHAVKTKNDSMPRP